MLLCQRTETEPASETSCFIKKLYNGQTQEEEDVEEEEEEEEEEDDDDDDDDDEEEESGLPIKVRQCLPVYKASHFKGI